MGLEPAIAQVSSFKSEMGYLASTQTVRSTGSENHSNFNSIFFFFLKLSRKNSEKGESIMLIHACSYSFLLVGNSTSNVIVHQSPRAIQSHLNKYAIKPCTWHVNLGGSTSNCTTFTRVCAFLRSFFLIVADQLVLVL